jgi:type VI secretion system protein ImpM
MSRTVNVAMSWFGKLPARGDFLRSTQQGVLTQMLDQWLSQGLDLMSTDARWKQIYDLAGATPFAFLGVRNRMALAGFLQPSSDASGRRFPFVLTGAVDVESATGFMPVAPLALDALWKELEGTSRQAAGVDDPMRMLNDLAQRSVVVEVDRTVHERVLNDFLADHTVGGLQALLRQAGHGEADVRRVLMAVGLLLQPVPGSGVSKLDKGVRLPLPADPLYRPQVASLWLSLVTPFISRANFEVSLHLPTVGGSRPMLAIGFAGASPQTLQAMLDPAKAEELFFELTAPDWVDEHAEQDYAMRKLSSYLQQPQLTLAQAVSTFKECFLGA